MKFDKVECQTIFIKYFSVHLLKISTSRGAIIESAAIVVKPPRLQDFRSPSTNQLEFAKFYDEISCYANTPPVVSNNILKFLREYPTLFKK